MTNVLMAAVIAAACTVSPVQNPAPGVIGPAAGQYPAWLVDGSSGQWSGAEERVKTLWVFSRKAAGSLRITGRRLDGSGTLRFQDGGVEGHPADALEIADPWTRSVRPGGASADILRAYSFIPNYVIYPSPGCWALDVELGGEKTRVTLEIR
jgi:hypothetical protein